MRTSGIKTRIAKRLWFWAAAICLGLFPGATAHADSEVDLPVSLLRELTMDGHRLTGSAASERVARRLEQELEARGVDSIIGQRFSSLRLRTTEAALMTEDGRCWPLLPARPNGLLPPVTPMEGVAGVLVSGASGEQPDVQWKDAIVVLNYSDAAVWPRAIRLGARAVVFVRDEKADAFHSLHVDASVPALRFYYSGTAKDLPYGEKVELKSSVIWEQSVGHNVIGVLGPEDADEAVILAVPRDTFGEVPEAAPGAIGAVNMVGLLEVAARLAEKDLKRKVLVAFLDAESHGMAGSVALHSLVSAKDGEENLRKREQEVKRELDYLHAILGSLRVGDLEKIPKGFRKDLQRQLQAFALGEVGDLEGRLAKMRRAEKANTTELRSLEAKRQGWNSFRRAIHNYAFPPDVEGYLSLARAAVIRDQEARLKILNLEQTENESCRRLREALGDCRIVLHLTLALGDTTRRWALLLGGDSGWHSSEDLPGMHGRVMAAFRAAVDDGTSELFEAASVDGRLPAGLALWGGEQLVHSGETAGLYGLHNGVLATVQERWARLGTPNDQVDAINLENVRDQLADLIPVLGRVIDAQELTGRSPIRPQVRRLRTGFSDDSRPTGPEVRERGLGMAVALRPLAGAVIELRARDPDLLAQTQARHFRMAGYDDHRLAWSSHNGTFGFAAATSVDKGDLAHALVFDARGLPMLSSNQVSVDKASTRLEVFPSWNGGFPLLETGRSGDVRFMNGRTQSPLEETRAFFGRRDGFLYWFVDRSMPALSVFGSSTAAIFRQPILPGEQPVLFRESARDLSALNAERNDLLRSRGVVAQSTDRILSQAALLRTSGLVMPERMGGEARLAAAFWGGVPVYEEIRGIFNDLVIAVLLLLLLALPFSFALERLLIGSTSIYRQLAGFAGIFVCAFLALFISHPAFAISSAPLIIFLGFGILLLASAVIVILMRRFENELRIAKGQGAGSHGQDISRMGALVAAMSMGISAMRRRRLRTTLTAGTVFLLAFCILVFASFTRSIAVSRSYIQPPVDYVGLMVGRPDSGGMMLDLGRLVSERWPEFRVARRHWDAQEKIGGRTWLVSDGSGRRLVVLRGVVGLDAIEVKERASLRALLGEPKADFDERIWLPTDVADKLQVGIGDKVLIQGTTRIVSGLLSAGQIAAVRDLDGQDMLPADFTSLDDASQTNPVATVWAGPPKSRQKLTANDIVIVSSRTAERMSMPLRAITLFGNDVRQVQSAADTLAVEWGLPVAASGIDGVYWHFLQPEFQASGWRDLLIPILLGGLVIFGTMLGSVVDREKEVSTFSALGLAPGHIAGLFLAEAAVYAVVGGFAGYLGTQVFAKVAGWAVNLGWIHAVELNHSSFNAMISLLLVIITVLCSAIYPAYRASKGANPEAGRIYRLPATLVDRAVIPFPFTVSEQDLPGVMAFLDEYFCMLKDGSFGKFETASVSIEDGPEGASLKAEVALQPYDLGVTQQLVISSRPSEIPGVREVSLEMHRLSGEPKNWRRLNMRFLTEMRRQFLFWRSLSQARMNEYRQRSSRQNPPSP
jgi:hypothetical protein